MKCPYRNFQECLETECAAYVPPMQLMENHFQSAWCRLTHGCYNVEQVDMYKRLIDEITQKGDF